MKDKISSVKIGKRAQQQFEMIRDNIEVHNGPKAANQFVRDFNRVQQQLKKTPYLFEASRKRKHTRCGMIDQHRSFLYRVYTSFIRITALFDTRTNQNYK